MKLVLDTNIYSDYAEGLTDVVGDYPIRSGSIYPFYCYWRIDLWIFERQPPNL